MAEITQVVDNKKAVNLTQVLNREAGIVEKLYIPGASILVAGNKNIEDVIDETITNVAANTDDLAAMKGTFTEALKTEIGDDPTLALAFTKIIKIMDVLQSDDTDLDTIQEFVSYVKENRTDIDTILTNYLEKNDLYSGLDSGSESLAATPKAIKTLKGLIDELSNDVNATLDDKMTKLTGGTAGNLTKISLDGNIEDSGIDSTKIAMLSDIETLSSEKQIAIGTDTIPDDLAIGGLFIQKITG